jgi:hypothetical protein
MTTRENRGGARVPDGIPRPPNVPMAGGANRQDLAQLPGTPGTALPEGIQEGPAFGAAGPNRRALSDLSFGPFNASKGGLLDAETEFPTQPITAGLPGGEGPGPESILSPPDQTSSTMAGRELATLYPVVMRLATLPNATSQTKILAQRLRTNLPKKPEQLRKPPSGNPRPS